MKTPTIIEYADFVQSSCSFWRARGPLSELAKQEKIRLMEGTWDDGWPTLRMCDIAFFQRPMNKKCIDQMLMIKDLGLKIWLDFDDFPHIPSYHPVYKQYTEIYDEKTFMKMFLLADVVTTSTEFIKQHLLQYHNNVINVA